MHVRRHFSPLWFTWAVTAACTHDARSTEPAARAENAGAAAPVLSSDAMAVMNAWSPHALVSRLSGAEESTTLLLSETGLYLDIVAKQLHPAAVEFSPTYPLWSDGSDKRRWLLLPQGEVIDDRNPDAWRFPVGTFAFKEFSHAGRRLETRLIARLGEGPEDYWMGSFVWSEDERDAQFVLEGAADVRGTTHDVPPARSCGTCHRGDPARYLGLSPVQAQLPPALLQQPAQFVVPGTSTEAAAIGYLHANCAHCHNPQGSARPDTDLDLRLRASDHSVRDTLVYTSTIGVPLQYFGAVPGTLRVVPGHPEDSALLLRMRERGNRTQMPPIATETIDFDGATAVELWISQLPSPDWTER